jgi:transcriptional regulator with XRE-family HTH domain
MATRKTIRESNMFLGKAIERLRILRNMSYMDLGRKINQTKQQIIRYERGEVIIPVNILEQIAYELEQPIAKRIIRKIVIARKIEREEEIELTDELIALYGQVLVDDLLE